MLFWVTDFPTLDASHSTILPPFLALHWHNYDENPVLHMEKSEIKKKVGKNLTF